MGQRDSSANYPLNLLDLAATAWAPPNLPLFPGAPAPMGAPVALSTPAAGAPPWLRPLHEIQRAALSPNPADPASSGDTAASPWMGPASLPPQLPLFAAPRSARGTYWSLLSPSGALLPITDPSYQPPRAMADIQPAPAPAPTPDVSLTANDVARSIATGIPITGGLASQGNAGDALDPARTRRLLERANRDYDFVRWLSGVSGVHPAQPMRSGAVAADATTTGIDDALDQPAPFNRPPPASSPPWLPLSAARKAEGVPSEGSYLSIVSPQGAILAPRMIDMAGGAGPANTAEGPDLVSLAEQGTLPRLLSPLPARPAPAASPQNEAKLTNKASWDPRTWSAYDNPLAWLQLDYERKFQAEAARLKRMPMGGDVPAFDAPSAARRMREAFVTGYGDEPIIPTQDPGSITKAGPVTIPEWAQPHVIALMRAGNSLPQAFDQVLRAGRGAIATVPALGAGAAQDLGIVDQLGADKLQGELGIFTQFPGEPGVPSLAVAPRVVPETVGQRVLRRAEERPAPLPNRSVEPFAPRPADLPDVDLAALEARAQEIHAGLGQRAQRHRTTAILSTNEKTIVGGGKRDLDPRQHNLLRDDEVFAKFPGEDAEITVLWKAVARGYTPRALATSRPICPECRFWIEAFGGKLLSPTLAIFPTR